MRKRQVRGPLPRYVQPVTSRGREYLYFRRGSQRSPLPSDTTTSEFWAAYRAALGSHVPRSNNFKDLIGAYKASGEFDDLASATRRDYLYYLNTIEMAWGELLVRSLRPKNVIELRDAWKETPSKANHLLSVLKTLINWGIPREYSDTNPCLAVPRFDLEEGGAKPWPKWAFALIEKHAPEPIHHAVWLGRYTGQREADIIRMGPGNRETGGVRIVQQKTGKELWIPLHRELKSEMRSWKGDPFVQHSNGKGYLTADSFRSAWTRLMNETPAGRIRKEGFTFHGLRAASCEKLREAGCPDAEIESITGMSQAMIRRYLRFADQKALARKAMQRLQSVKHRKKRKTQLTES